MSVVRLRRIRCDHHGCRQTIEAADIEDESAAYIRRRGRVDGWVQRGSKDYCPKHVGKSDG